VRKCAAGERTWTEKSRDAEHACPFFTGKKAPGEAPVQIAEIPAEEPGDIPSVVEPEKTPKSVLIEMALEQGLIKNKTEGARMKYDDLAALFDGGDAA
jgi:hypothetical protein